MTIDRGELLGELADLQPEAASDAPVSVPALVRGWLAQGPRVLTGDDRSALDALCRQIDVRRKVSAEYDEGFGRRDPETPVAPSVRSGLVAVLLANAAGVGEPGPDGSLTDGWGLKCANSALKALELDGEPPHAPELRAWAFEVLDRASLSGTGTVS